MERDHTEKYKVRTKLFLDIDVLWDGPVPPNAHLSMVKKKAIFTSLAQQNLISKYTTSYSTQKQHVLEKHIECVLNFRFVHSCFNDQEEKRENLSYHLEILFSAIMFSVHSQQNCCSTTWFIWNELSMINVSGINIKLHRHALVSQRNTHTCKFKKLNLRIPVFEHVFLLTTQNTWYICIILSQINRHFILIPDSLLWVTYSFLLKLNIAWLWCALRMVHFKNTWTNMQIYSKTVKAWVLSSISRFEWRTRIKSCLVIF